jgi:hypothetical protein
MWTRGPRCAAALKASPEGAPWKRIDYAWSKGLTPIAIERFGLPAPGDAAPSDHAGIVAEYRQ